MNDRAEGKTASPAVRIVGITLIILTVVLAVFGGLVATMIVIEMRTSQPKSEWEKHQESHTLGLLDIRARTPYTTFQPRMPRGDMPFSFSELTDTPGLARQLVAAEADGRPSPALRLWESMPDGARQGWRRLAEGTPPSGDEMARINGALQSAMASPRYYVDRYFPGVDVFDYFKRLLRRDRTTLLPFEVQALNRFLFEQSFPGQLRRIHVNSQGFFSPELPMAKKSGEFRIAVLGGSMAFSAGFADETLAGMLASELAQHEPALAGRQITYINAGMPSAISNQELARLVHQVLDFTPDLIVVFDGFNDLFIPFSGAERRVGYPYDYVVEEYRYYNFRHGSILQALLDFPIRKKLRAAPMALVQKYYDDLGIRVPPPAEVTDEILSNYFGNIEKITRIGGAYGIPVVVALQPYSLRHPPHDPMITGLYGQAKERFTRLASTNSATVAYVDLTSLNEVLADLFMDSVHYFADKGNPTVAAELHRTASTAGMFRTVPR